MAVIIGSLRPEATRGEQLVLKLFQDLPDDYYVWPELTVGDLNPDFVLVHPRLGLAVLEVKDWGEVVAATPELVTVRNTNGHEHVQTNPEKSTRLKATTIANKLAREPRLLHADGDYAGKSRVPWAYGVVFANLTRMFAGIVSKVLNDQCAIYRDELGGSAAFEQAIRRLDWRFEANLSDHDISLIRGTLYPELQVGYRAADGRITLGVADVTQEQIAREGLNDRPPREEAEASSEGKRAAANVAVRMVRGPAGTGKTLVLILRAKYLARLNPTWRILVVAFNRALAEQLRDHFDHYSENITVGTFHQLCQQVLSQPDHWGQGPVDNHFERVSAAMNEVDGARQFGANFLSEEIKWMKEVGATGRERYLDIPRLGRGRPLQREEREIVYRVFEGYQNQLVALRRFDWEDSPGMALAALREAPPDRFRYDAILVDEAQDFAPVWFDVLRRLLNPQTGSMFLAADGAQRIYRHYSWRALGLDVVGRSRILRRSYRNTFEIAQVARELLHDQPSIQAALKLEEDEADLFEPEERWMRHGLWPAVNSFNGDGPEHKWLTNRLRELLQDGYRPEDIALFARDGKTVEATVNALRAARLPAHKLNEPADAPAIAVGTMHAAKGLEFRAVFVMRLDQLFAFARRRQPQEEQRRHEADEFRLLYVAMTRARDRLFLEYQYPLPPQLIRFIDYVKRT